MGECGVSSTQLPWKKPNFTLPHLALKHDIYQKVHFLRKEKCAYYLSYATLVSYVAIVGSVLWQLLCRDNVGEFTIFFIHECPYFILLMPSFNMAYNLHLKYSIKGFIFSYEQLYSSSWKGFLHFKKACFFSGNTNLSCLNLSSGAWIVDNWKNIINSYIISYLIIAVQWNKARVRLTLFKCDCDMNTY